ncbi:MAG: DEAD/DEAH box helicase [Ignavibacteria bacterium]|jgi:ATP-dependent RNA helicase DeaD
MTNFEELGIGKNILKAINELGFEKPMPIQTEVIPQLIKNISKDIVALAQTGTGKTAAFGLPIIQNTNPAKKQIQYLILSPTRELCVQIADDLISFAKYKEGIKIAAVFGGSSIERQIKMIKKGAQIISATPGRLLDLIKRNAVNLSRINTVVLDEADEMLNMGFRDDLEAILENTPAEKNTLLFSATMPKEVLAISRNYMHDPVEITIGKKNVGAENVSHEYYMVHAKDRYLALKRIADYYPEIYGIIFCRTRKETQEVAEMLIKDGYNADSLHGDLSQAQRDSVMNKFRIKHLKLLVATDVAARGLDVDNLSHIINYNLPDELEIYTHRSGRTGRAGRTGTSIVIANMREKNKIKDIERILNKKFTKKEIPSGKEICKKQLYHLIDRMEKVVVDYSEIESFLPNIFKKLEWLDREELIKKFVSLEFNRFLSYYKNTVDLNAPGEKQKREKQERLAPSDYSRFFINLGKRDDIKPVNIIGMINDYTGIRGINIGEIEILNNFSFFETDKKYEDNILKSFRNKERKGRTINVEISEKKKNFKKKKEKSKKKRQGESKNTPSKKLLRKRKR